MTTQVQPQDKTVFANGLNLHYLDWGTVGKPAMVLLHGLRGHAHSWDDFSGAVCQQYHVLALDQRGRGLSDWAKDGDYSTGAYVADLAAFCDALGLDSPVLVGHSMGGKKRHLLCGPLSSRGKKARHRGHGSRPGPQRPGTHTPGAQRRARCVRLFRGCG